VGRGLAGSRQISARKAFSATRGWREYMPLLCTMNQPWLLIGLNLTLMWWFFGMSIIQS
jgi:hypothetical protein